MCTDSNNCSGIDREIHSALSVHAASPVPSGQAPGLCASLNKTFIETFKSVINFIIFYHIRLRRIGFLFQPLAPFLIFHIFAAHAKLAGINLLQLLI